MTRCPHCGESFVLPPLPRPDVGGLPPALRTLAWCLLGLAALRMVSFVQLLVTFGRFGMFGALDLVSVFGTQLGHTALLVAAGVGLLRARSWAPAVAWLQVAMTVFSLGRLALSFVGIGFGALSMGLDLGTLSFLLSLAVAVLTVVVLVRPDVRAVFRRAV